MPKMETNEKVHGLEAVIGYSLGILVVIAFWLVLLELCYGQGITHYVSQTGIEEDWSLCTTPDRRCSLRTMFLYAVPGDNVNVSAGVYRVPPLAVDRSNEGQFPFRYRSSIYERSCVVTVPGEINRSGFAMLIIRDIVITGTDEAGEPTETIVGTNCYIEPDQSGLPTPVRPFTSD